MKKITISRDQIKAWNRLGEAMRGKANYYVFLLQHESKDDNGKWEIFGHGLINNYRSESESDRYYIKKVKDAVYLYFENETGSQRWLLSDIAQAYFNTKEEN